MPLFLFPLLAEPAIEAGTASADQGVLRRVRECGQNTNMDCYLRLRPGCNHQEAVEPGAKSLYNFTIISVTLFEKIPLLQALADTEVQEENTIINNQMNLFN